MTSVAHGGVLPDCTEAAVLHGPGDVRLEMVSLPVVGPEDLVIQMASGGICGSDMHYFAQGRNGQNELKAPAVLGHEGAGTVLAGGSDTGIDPGTSVVIEPAISCGKCTSCRTGHSNVCPFGFCFGSPPTNGLFTRYAIVPESSVHILPPTIPAHLGAAIEPLAVAVWAVQRAEIHEGHRVLITGAGPIGLLVAQVAAVHGASEITVTDVNDDRLAAAASFGATHTINAATSDLEGAEFDRLIECSGNPTALNLALRSLRPAGRATVVGQAPACVDGLPLGFLQRYEIDLVTAFRYARAFPTAISMAAAGQVRLEDIVTAQYPLAEIEDALLAPTRDPRNLKVLLSY